MEPLEISHRRLCTQPLAGWSWFGVHVGRDVEIEIAGGSVAAA